MILFQGNIYTRAGYDPIYFRLVAENKERLEAQLKDITGFENVVMKHNDEDGDLSKGYYYIQQVYDLDMHLKERRNRDDD